MATHGPCDHDDKVINHCSKGSTGLYRGIIYTIVACTEIIIYLNYRFTQTVKESHSRDDYYRLAQEAGIVIMCAVIMCCIMVLFGPVFTVHDCIQLFHEDTLRSGH